MRDFAKDSQLNDQYVAFVTDKVIADRSREGTHLLAEREPFFVEISQQIQHSRRFATSRTILFMV